MEIHFAAIYAIRNTLNKKCYIGSTNDFYVRKNQHLVNLRANRHHSPILQHSYNKYGESVFTFEIIEIISDIKDLLWKEQHYLDTLKPQYNVCKKVEQSRLGLKSTPEHCAHMSAALKGRTSPMKGKKFSTEHKAKISKANKGICHSGWHHTKKAKDNMSLHHNKNSNNLKSIETKNRISEANYKRWASYSEKKRKEISKKVSQAQAILKETTCIICNKKIVFHSSGKYIPKTCSPECLSESRKRNLSVRNKKGLGKKASLKRWSLIPKEEREKLGKKIGDKLRKPLKETICIICSKKIIYKTQGKQIPKTCSPDCLTKFRRNLLNSRRQKNPDMDKLASQKRWYANLTKPEED